MTITNTPKPTPAVVTNTSKVSIGETWGSILTTWSSETRTWLAVSQLVTNTILGSDPIWSYRSFPWLMSLPWQQPRGMINTNKP
jgi:hypothetical protein